ncbi:helix-turn-helix domain-containing protein [uncultured Methanobrevibacter sp.]|uniref:winged helix-turn-helix transcriptional regulator n=1 Tax=uncultured Methanobrevibacter sp. TaxID=253161 RepID=UPI0025D619A8|nr:helix-turn-helix domain-containing protein [uncultured Methanobrevibacter sp.]
MVLKDKLYGNQFERNVVGEAIKSISNKWTFYILKDLFLGKKHFTQFQENRPNLDNKSLTRCLKSMENNDLIEKNVKNHETEYVLTSKGRKLNKVFYELIIFSLDTHEGDFYTDEEIDFIKKSYVNILEL